MFRGFAVVCLCLLPVWAVQGQGRVTLSAGAGYSIPTSDDFSDLVEAGEGYGARLEVAMNHQFKFTGRFGYRRFGVIDDSFGEIVDGDTFVPFSASGPVFVDGDVMIISGAVGFKYHLPSAFGVSIYTLLDVGIYHFDIDDIVVRVPERDFVLRAPRPDYEDEFGIGVGGGLSVPLGSVLSLFAEARAEFILADTETPHYVPLKAGLALNFGRYAFER